MSALAASVAGSRSDEAPARSEWWASYAALLAVALVPALVKLRPDDPTASAPVAEALWTCAYLYFGWRLFRDPGEGSRFLRGSAVLAAFVLLMALSTLWSENGILTLKNSAELAGSTLLAGYLAARYPLPRLLGLANAAFGTVAVLSLLTIVFAPGHGRMDWGSGAWSGVFQEKNNLGTAMGLAIICATASLLGGSRGRLRLLAALALYIVLLCGSHSATASIATAAAIAMGLAARLWTSPRTDGSARLCLCACVFVGALVALGVGWRPDSLFGMFGRDETLTGRTDFWPILTDAIGNRPILGYGYNAFFQSADGSDALSYYVVEAGGWTPYHAHDSFLQICLDAGFVGLAVLIALLAVALLRALRYVATQRGMVAAWPLMIVAFIIFGSYTETYVGSYNSYEWLLFVAAMLYPLRGTAGRAVASKGGSL